MLSSSPFNIVFSKYSNLLFLGCPFVALAYIVFIKNKIQQKQLCEEVVQLCFHLYAFFYLALNIPAMSMFGIDMDVMDFETDVEYELAEKLLYFRNYFYFYCVMLIATLIDKNSEKKLEMTIHHAATIVLMAIAGMNGYMDISVYVLYINNIADIFLGPSKILNIFKNNWRVPFFVAFALTHLILRCVFFPVNIVKLSYHEKINSLLNWSAFLCLPLIILNNYWAFYICRVCLKFFQNPNKKIT
jgi:hypothetical protein